MRPPIYLEERILFGAVVGAAAWGLWKFVLQAGAEAAFRAGLAGALVGGVLGAYVIQLVLAIVLGLGILSIKDPGAQSEALGDLRANRDTYFP